MSFYIQLAGQIIKINNKYRQIEEFCQDYMLSLTSFNCPVMTIEAYDQDYIAEKELIYKKNSNVIAEGMYTFFNPGELESLIAYKKICEEMPKYDTFLMHGSVVATNSCAYMFTAPSGTGKTTRTRLWLERFPGSYVINGDKPLLRFDNDQIYACGTPWCGKEGWNKNVQIPLKAIYILERSKDEESSYITKANSQDVFELLLNQTFKPHAPSLLYKTLCMLKILQKRINIYHFISARSYESIDLAWKTANTQQDK